MRYRSPYLAPKDNTTAPQHRQIPAPYGLLTLNYAKCAPYARVQATFDTHDTQNPTPMLQSRLFLLSLSTLLMASCSSIYQCGETRPENFRANKHVLAVVNERDSLCTTLAAEEAKSERLSTELTVKTTAYTELDGRHSALQSDYKRLQAESAATTDELRRDLSKKSNELSEKERTLQEREKALREMQAVIARQDSITNRLNSILRDALLGFQDDELSVEVKNGKVYVSMSDKLLFRSGSAGVENKGKEAIVALAGVLEKNPDIDILIEGHTDNVPIRTATFKDNWDLSTARATAIVRLLSDAHGIAPTRLTAAGRGEFQPRTDNSTAEGRASNRRTEIILSPKLDELMNLLY